MPFWLISLLLLGPPTVIDEAQKVEMYATSGGEALLRVETLCSLPYVIPMRDRGILSTDYV